MQKMNQIFVTLSRIKLIKKLRVNFVYVTLFLIRDPPKNQWKLLYKVRKNLKKLIKHYLEIQ